MIVNKRQLADIFGISLPTVRSWIDKGMPVVTLGSEGLDYEFSTADVLKWRRKAIREGEFNKGRAPDMRRLKAKVETLELTEELKQIDLESLRNSYVVKEDADESILWAKEVIEKETLSLAEQVTPQILGITDEASVESILETYIHQTMSKLSDLFEKESNCL